MTREEGRFGDADRATHEPSPTVLAVPVGIPSAAADWIDEAIARHLEKHPPKPPCEHEFSGWRVHSDGLGGEQFCQNCGLGAMANTLMLDWD